MRCAWCRGPLDWLHGHAACLESRCPMYGVNQSECCSGETEGAGWIPTSDLAACDSMTDEPPPEPPDGSAAPPSGDDATRE